MIPDLQSQLNGQISEERKLFREGFIYYVARLEFQSTFFIYRLEGDGILTCSASSSEFESTAMGTAAVPSSGFDSESAITIARPTSMLFERMTGRATDILTLSSGMTLRHWWWDRLKERALSPRARCDNLGSLCMQKELETAILFLDGSFDGWIPGTAIEEN